VELIKTLQAVGIVPPVRGSGQSSFAGMDISCRIGVFTPNYQKWIILHIKTNATFQLWFFIFSCSHLSCVGIDSQARCAPSGNKGMDFPFPMDFRD
jgi:hypothetical protein